MISTLRKKKILAGTSGGPVVVAAINFRTSVAYVTDGAGETYCRQIDLYPTVRGGYTFGWVSFATQTADRNNAIDRRLAGICYDVPAITFRLDLPAPGNYSVRLAFGDAGGGHPDMSAVFKDGATTLFSLLNKANTGGSFFDATGVEYNAATWPINNTARAVVMAGTALTIDFSAGSNVWTVAHVSVTSP